MAGILALPVLALHSCLHAGKERRQLMLGRQLLARTREIGDASQFTGTFRPGDPRLIFGLYEPGH